MADYIKREDAIDAIREKFFTMSMCVSVDECKGMRYAQDLCAKTVERLPDADVRPVVHGRWVADGDGYHWTYNCSICGWKDGYPFNERHNYCPNCGAKMEVQDG